MILMVIVSIVVSSLLLILVCWISTITGCDKWLERFQYDWVKLAVCLAIVVASLLIGFSFAK